jgi:inward rectifier potassium channel
VFALSLTAMHPIDEKSPLYGKSPASLRAESAEFIASLIGTDETFSQTVHARYAYHIDDVVWDARLADLFVTDASGKRVVDYRQFHTAVPVDSSS